MTLSPAVVAGHDVRATRKQLIRVKRQALFRPQLFPDLGCRAITAMFVGVVLGAPQVLFGGTVDQPSPSAVRGFLAA